jgi:hypothetical protein
MLCFFKSLIDFDWIEGHLTSGRVSLTSLKNRVGSGSGPDGSGGFFGSDRVLPPLERYGQHRWMVRDVRRWEYGGKKKQKEGREDKPSDPNQRQRKKRKTEREGWQDEAKFGDNLPTERITLLFLPDG